LACAGVIIGYIISEVRRIYTQKALKEYIDPCERKIAKGSSITCHCGAWLDNLTECTYKRHLESLKHARNMEALRADGDLVVCEEVREYRAFAKQNIQKTDRILEIGCHNGATTKVIWSRNPECLVAIDQKKELVDVAREALPGVKFNVQDAFDTYELRKLEPEGGFTHVFVDISGNRELRSVVQLLDQVEASLRPKHIIVKSQKLRRLLLRSKLWRDLAITTD